MTIEEYCNKGVQGLIDNLASFCLLLMFLSVPATIMDFVPGWTWLMPAGVCLVASSAGLAIGIYRHVTGRYPEGNA